MTYVKLHSSILTSSLAGESLQVRWLFVGVMLPLADRDGIVEASLPGLAHLARFSIEETERALAVLSSPDQHSRCKDHEGRRIEAVDGGWRLLSYERYRDKSTPDEARAKAAARQRRKRERDASRDVTVSHGASRAVTPSEAEAEAEAEAVQKQKRAPRAATAAPRPDDVSIGLWEDWIAHRKAKRASVSTTVLDSIRAEAAKAGMSLAKALEVSVAQGWQGFRAEWLQSRSSGPGGRAPTVPKQQRPGTYGDPVQEL